jgi:hypothetical protein
LKIVLNLTKSQKEDIISFLDEYLNENEYDMIEEFDSLNKLKQELEK